MVEKKDFRIIFMGTPEFAVGSLKMLLENNFNVVAVVTAADKPAGRGQQLNQSAVKIFATEKNIPVLQPANLKDEEFLKQLKTYTADLQVIVAFRMLPERIWSQPPMGSINLHASLLPQYRGAAPINWAIINGEEETGVTTFFLKHEIDTGNILFQKKISIKPNDTAGIIHDILMQKGAELLSQTVDSIRTGNFIEIPQPDVATELLKHAPKIFKEDCKVNWENNIHSIHNLIRGLSPYPAAWAYFEGANKQNLMFKIYQSQIEFEKHSLDIGTLVTDERNFLKVAVNGGLIVLKEIQLSGKKRMMVTEFLNGFKDIKKFKAG